MLLIMPYVCTLCIILCSLLVVSSQEAFKVLPGSLVLSQLLHANEPVFQPKVLWVLHSFHIFGLNLGLVSFLWCCFLFFLTCSLQGEFCGVTAK